MQFSHSSAPFRCEFTCSEAAPEALRGFGHRANETKTLLTACKQQTVGNFSSWGSRHPFRTSFVFCFHTPLPDFQRVVAGSMVQRARRKWPRVVGDAASP